MKRITKKSLEKNLRFTKDGNIHKNSLSALNSLLEDIKPKTKIFYKTWGGSRKHMKLMESIDTYLLGKFCKFEIGNDAPRGGAEGDFITVSTKEYNLLKKRISMFTSEAK